MATWELISHLLDESSNEVCSQVINDNELGPKIIKVEGNCETAFSTDEEASHSPSKSEPKCEVSASTSTPGRTSNSPLNKTNNFKPRTPRCEKSMQNHRWAVNVWQTWAMCRTSLARTGNEEVPVVPVDLKYAQQNQMTYWMPKFIKEAKTAEGTDYNPGSMKQLLRILHLYMKEECQYTGPSFFKIHSQLLPNVVGSNQRQDDVGEGGKPKMAKVSRATTITKLWELNILDLLTSEGLLNTVLVYNKEALGLRSRTEHRHLKLEHLRLKKDKIGRKYVAFTKPLIPGIVQLSYRKPVRYYERLDDSVGKNSPSYFEVLRTYYKYLPERSGPFYRRQATASGATSHPKFTKFPMSELALGEMLTSIYLRAEERSDVKNDNQTKSSIDVTKTKQQIDFKPPAKWRYEDPVIIPIINLDDDEESANVPPSPNEAGEKDCFDTTPSRGGSYTNTDATSAGSSGLCYNFAVENGCMCLQVSADVPVSYAVSSDDGGKLLKFCFQTT